MVFLHIASSLRAYQCLVEITRSEKTKVENIQKDKIPWSFFSNAVHES
jgi:hypothetical protein